MASFVTLRADWDRCRKSGFDHTGCELYFTKKISTQQFSEQSNILVNKQSTITQFNLCNCHTYTSLQRVLRYISRPILLQLHRLLSGCSLEQQIPLCTVMTLKKKRLQ